MKSNSTIIIGLLAAAVLLLGYIVYDRRSRGEKAVDSLRDAGRSVQDAISPRTVPEKIRDSVKDTVHDLKKD
jgi:hypothetical protein